jgi:predicted DNA-binding transcriptional regulator AlpA
MPDVSLLSLAAVAERLGVSLSLVQRLARAAEIQAEIQTGRRARNDVPEGLRRYLDCRFPRPVRIGRAVRRIRTRDLEAWLG